MAGRMLDLGLGYGAVFSIMGMCHVTAFFVILIAIPRIQQVAGSGAREVGSSGARRA
jgi:hypothetical protein